MVFDSGADSRAIEAFVAPSVVSSAGISGRYDLKFREVASELFRRAALIKAAETLHNLKQLTVKR